MSLRSRSAAYMWRVEREAWGKPARCNRWWVYRVARAGWQASPPCRCHGDHDETRTETPVLFATHAQAIAYATEQARAQWVQANPSLPRRKP